MATISDVAKAAGVSPMTVSNVINDHPHVRSSTRARVVKAMAELDYRVNIAARNLRAGRTGIIGLAVPEIDRPYFGQLAALIIEHAAPHGLRVVVEQTGAMRDNELAALAQSRMRMYDGLILSSVGLGPSDGDLLRVDYPVVLLGEGLFGAPVDHVGMANAEGARLATLHLVERGCRRIALIGAPHAEETSGAARLRSDGYRSALAESGIEHDPQLEIMAGWSMVGGADAVRELVASGVEFDGAVCMTDYTALGVLRGLADEGISVPGRVRVIGFDNILEARFSVPSLTTMAQDHDQMARLAVDLLWRRISGDVVTEPTEVVVDFGLVVRESA